MALIYAMIAALLVAAAGLIASWMPTPEFVKRRRPVGWALLGACVLISAVVTYVAVGRLAQPGLRFEVTVAPCTTSGTAELGAGKRRGEDATVGDTAVLIKVVNARQGAVDAAIDNFARVDVRDVEEPDRGSSPTVVAGPGCSAGQTAWLQPVVELHDSTTAAAVQDLAYGDADFFTVAAASYEFLGVSFRCTSPGLYSVSVRLRPEFPSGSLHEVLSDVPILCPWSYSLRSATDATDAVVFRWDGDRYVSSQD